MIFGYTFYEIAVLFFIYSFLGWLMEVVFRGLSEGKFVNSGFLNGPVCPIYGFGGVIVILCLTPIENNIVLLFVGSMVLTSLLELVTGFLLDKLFHTHWWDYNDKPFNLGGYICLQFSVAWGLVCIALMKGIHPPIINIVRAVPFVLGLVWLVVTAAIFAADIVITVITISHLTKRVRIMDEIAEGIHSISDGIGSHVYEGASKIVNKGVSFLGGEDVHDLKGIYEENVENLKHRQKELKDKYTALLQEPHLLQRRILKAFPKLKMEKYNEQLEKIKDKLSGAGRRN